MEKQYDVDVIESIAKTISRDVSNISRWANNQHRIKNDEETFVFHNCYKESDGSFVYAGFQHTYIPKECVSSFVESKIRIMG